MNGLNNKNKQLKIAIPIIGDKNWMGGITYIHYLVNALSFLQENKPEIYLVFRDRHLEALPLHKYMFELFDGLIYVGSNNPNIPYDYLQCDSYDELSLITDVYFPLVSEALPNRCSISWIPDFQHKYLPEMFSVREINHRDEAFEKVSKSKCLVIFSSKDSKKDYDKFYPFNNTINRIMSFYLVPPDEWYKEDDDILEKYGVEENYFICSNQFWKHKNHLILFQAIKLLKDKGLKIRLVLTGAKRDARNPDYYDQLMQYVQENNLVENVKILGFIDRFDQIQLMRNSLAVLQPSLFEGWGTVLEDARVLGKTVILSNIPIHLEQKTEYSLFFEKDSVTDFANKIEQVFRHPEQFKSKEREKSSREQALINVKRYAENFMQIAYEAYFLYQEKEGYR